MRLLLLVAVLPTFLSGCTSDPATGGFDNVSWIGNHTIEPGSIRFDGTGEATFLAYLDCGEHVYAWYSTDEGAEGTLVVRIRDGANADVLTDEYRNENHEHDLSGAAGRWSIQVTSSADFAGNGIAFLECDPAPLQSL